MKRIRIYTLILSCYLAIRYKKLRLPYRDTKIWKRCLITHNSLCSQTVNDRQLRHPRHGSDSHQQFLSGWSCVFILGETRSWNPNETIETISIRETLRRFAVKWGFSLCCSTGHLLLLYWLVGFAVLHRYWVTRSGDTNLSVFGLISGIEPGACRGHSNHSDNPTVVIETEEISSSRSTQVRLNIDLLIWIVNVVSCY